MFFLQLILLNNNEMMQIEKERKRGTSIPFQYRINNNLENCFICFE